MDRLQALVADGQAAVAGQPGEGALHQPTVPPQAALALDAPAGDPGGDAALAQGCPAGGVVVTFVGVQLRREARQRQRVEEWRGDGVVVAIRGGQPRRERDAAASHEEVPLGARPAAVRRVRADRVAPLFAATLALSALARDQSRCWASSRRVSRRRWRRCQTPARSHSRSRRQQVTPLPPPSSAGSIRHWIPVRST